MIIYNRCCDLSELSDVARRLAGFCLAGTVIYLRGELGAGKTTFVRCYLSGLGYSGVVKSPTYTLVEPYSHIALGVFHFDLYRLNHPQELFDIGMDDYFSEGSQVFIEWPEKGQGVLPPADLEIIIQKMQNPDHRLVKMVATSQKAITLLKGFT